MDKSQGRNYILMVETISGSEIKITMPLSIEFDIQKSISGSANAAVIKIFNLREDTRRQIHKRRIDLHILKAISLLAGYGDSLAVSLSGTISACWSVRQGPDIVTIIEVFDAGYAFANAMYSKQFNPGTPVSVVVKDMVGTLKHYGVDEGAIGSIDGKSGRGSSYSGPTIELIKELTGGSFFIDNGKAYILSENEFLITDEVVVNAATGLIGSPVEENGIVTVTMVFEPRIIIGQSISLESTTSDNFNTKYKVIGVHHRGIISDAVAGTATTSLTLSYGDDSLSPVAGGAF